MENERYPELMAWAEQALGGDILIEKETHGDRSDVFRVTAGEEIYFLKIGEDFVKEQERLEWLRDKLPVARVVATTEQEGKQALLLTGIRGKNLKLLSQEWPPEKTVEKLAAAIRKFQATSLTDWPYGTVQEGMVLVHGDACLPNFVFAGDELAGYIDVGDTAAGDSRTDYAAAIWSLEHNLGKGYGTMFLEKVGVPGATEEMAETLRLRYEDMQKEWGLFSENPE